MTALRVIVETSSKRTFATAADWPGWARGARTEADALTALAMYAPRYAIVAREAGLEPPAGDEPLEIVDRVEGSAGTAFGVPSHVAPADRAPTDAVEATRRADLVAAAWAVFDRVAAGAPAELRKGPRGGGRDTASIVEHVVGADGAYAREMGLRLPAVDPADGASVERLRAAILETLRAPSDGSALGGRRWTARYAAQRVAWHALDHAWEIEDRSEPLPAGT